MILKVNVGSNNLKKCKLNHLLIYITLNHYIIFSSGWSKGCL